MYKEGDVFLNTETGTEYTIVEVRPNEQLPYIITWMDLFQEERLRAPVGGSFMEGDAMEFVNETKYEKQKRELKV